MKDKSLRCNDTDAEETHNSAIYEIHNGRFELAVEGELARDAQHGDARLCLEQDETLNSFRQHIHDLEKERELLLIRLSSVEMDYEMQIKELQNSIVSMRVDIRKQKEMYEKIEGERLSTITQLAHRNKSMSKRLAAACKNEAQLKHEIQSLRSQCNSRKSTIHENFQQLEILRREITQLRSEKMQLESQLRELSQDKEELLRSLIGCEDYITELKRKNQEQITAIQSQDTEIAHLQEKVNTLHEHIQALSNQSDHASNTSSSCSSARHTQPHRSLLAELAERRLDLVHGEPKGRSFVRKTCAVKLNAMLQGFLCAMATHKDKGCIYKHDCTYSKAVFTLLIDNYQTDL
ncbi:unnamed protein product [Dicrocoelium dendriticum]|nr:unnamed protein product [Dicrocoelium dendriticum]